MQFGIPRTLYAAEHELFRETVWRLKKHLPLRDLSTSVLRFGLMETRLPPIPFDKPRANRA